MRARPKVTITTLAAIGPASLARDIMRLLLERGAMSPAEIAAALPGPRVTAWSVMAALEEPLFADLVACRTTYMLTDAGRTSLSIEDAGMLSQKVITE